METPICDFVRSYARSDALRLHMPGHKGVPVLGFEHLDITEFDGADSLYEPDGIIKHSEDNASQLFGCRTVYSTEGSSQCIRAMLYLAMQNGKRTGKQMRILAGRNAHKSFLSAVALLDLEVTWLYPDKGSSYLSCSLDLDFLEQLLNKPEQKPMAVYVTSPDYLGNMADIPAIAEVCHRHGVLLLVDNAHGAYLRFLPISMHPMDLGADICCDSAHKTLPVLTGGAYLHFSSSMEPEICQMAKTALAMFGSTSPSYLTLLSLDAANLYLEDYPQRLQKFLVSVEGLKTELRNLGYTLCEMEPLKLTVSAKTYGYTGNALAAALKAKGIFTEFYDPDYLVLMLTPEICEKGLSRLLSAMRSLPRLSPIDETPPEINNAQCVMSVRTAALSACECLLIEQCKDRVLASASVGCPPAVPILVCGERIDKHAIECFRYYGIKNCSVVIE